MTYHITNQSIDIMRPLYLDVRKFMDETKDSIGCFCKYDDVQEDSESTIHLKILKLEGEYRAMNDSWNRPQIRLNIITVL